MVRIFPYTTHSKGNRRFASANRLAVLVTAIAVCMMFSLIGPVVPGSGGNMVGWLHPSACSAEESKGVRNVILFIGDGMGPGHLEAARNASPFMLTMDFMPVMTRITTVSWGGHLTDSAAGATALATGHKTVNRSLGVLPDGTAVPNILEAARDSGRYTGLVSTASITDATPAGFSVHVSDRGSGRQIAAEMVETGVDVILGGGAASFLPTLFQRTVPPMELAKDKGYTVIQEREPFLEASSMPLLGLFALTDMDYDVVRVPEEQPSLAEMTAKAIELLSSAGGKGFFLMVEGARIDDSCHDNDAEMLVSEMLAFDRAVSVGLDWASGRDDTLVIVTADHETGGVEASNGTITFSTDGHTMEPVYLYAQGPCSELFASASDNTDVARLMAMAMQVNLGEVYTVGESHAEDAADERNDVCSDGEVAKADAEKAEAEKAAHAESSVERPRLEAKPAHRVNVMTYNIHSGVGADLLLDLDRIADLILAEGVDIVGMCEVDCGTQRSGEVDQAAYISEKLGYEHVYGRTIYYGGGQFGNALISRYPIRSWRNHPLPNPAGNEPRAVLEAQVDVDGTILNVFVTHLDVKAEEGRQAQVGALLDIASQAVGPKVMMGDFNASPHTEEIARALNEFNDTMPTYRVLVDSAELIKEGLFARDYLKGGYTYDAYSPSRRIDYIFTSFDIGIAQEPGAARVPRTLASDHLPYIATLDVPSEELSARKGTEELVVVFASRANEAWYEDMRWDYQCQIDAIFEMAEEAGYECVEASEDDIGILPYVAELRPTILVLSNARRMSETELQAVRDFVAAGGKVLATGQTSLKTVDEKACGVHGFHLADLLGVAFVGWQGVAPLHSRIMPAGADGVISLPLEVPDSRGIIVRRLPGARELGSWADADGSPTHAEHYNSAVVLAGRVMYVGCDILSPEMLSDDNVRLFVADALDMLVRL
ncbi:MAG: alkaline phosphatase [Firmicutes bacterium]|nr:alkaline phosphatase [Bacillota bacterium]